ncbi:MAG: hypothetical protein ACMXYF_02710 [Candidatus Woesearchaeota archaeon]
MTKTMIQVDSRTRDLIKSLGKMGETYDDVIQRMYKQTTENMIAKLLLDTSDCVSIEEILQKRDLSK